jgi:hypothetical protein
MKRKLTTLVFALFVFSIPLLSIVNGQPLTDVPRDLRSELKMVCEQERETSFESEELQEFWIEEVRHNRRIFVLGAKWSF